MTCNTTQSERRFKREIENLNKRKYYHKKTLTRIDEEIDNIKNQLKLWQIKTYGYKK
jgi:prefoldin subunit 5